VLNTDWLISRTTVYAADCKAPCTPGTLVVPGLSEASIAGRAAGRYGPLIPDGTESLPAINNLDFRFGKWFSFGRFEVQGLAEIYNLLNISTALAVRSSSYGTPTFHQPGGSGDVGTRGAIPYARFLKFGVQARW